MLRPHPRALFASFLCVSFGCAADGDYGGPGDPADPAAAGDADADDADADADDPADADPGDDDGAQGSGHDGAHTGFVIGRIDDDGGNQGHAQADLSAIVGASLAIVSTIGKDGSLTAVASALVAADGTFHIDDVPLIDGPFVVSLQGEGDVQLGSVLSLHGVADGESVLGAPISAETTAEVEAYLQLLASGTSEGDIDAIGLMTQIDAALAASVDTGADLAAEVMAAQQAKLSVLSALSGQLVTGAQLQALKTDAYADLVVQLDAAATVDGQLSAWGEFVAEAQATVVAQLDLDLKDVLTAEGAAQLTFLQHLAIEGDGLSEAAIEAAITLVADLQADVMIEAGAESEAAAQVVIEVEAALAVLTDGLSSGNSIEAALVAHAAFTSDLGLDGIEGGSVLDLLLTGDVLGGLNLSGVLDDGTNIEAEIAAQLDATLDAAAGNPALNAAAFVQLQATIETALDGALGGDGDDELLDTLLHTILVDIVGEALDPAPHPG